MTTTKVDELMAAGYEQVSRKYRLVGCLPPGKTGLEALREVNPALAQSFLNNANEQAKFMFLRGNNEHTIELSPTEFEEFLTKKVEKWKAAQAEADVKGAEFVRELLQKPKVEP